MIMSYLKTFHTMFDFGEVIAVMFADVFSYDCFLNGLHCMHFFRYFDHKVKLMSHFI
jgi:3-isopropylmalate dehydratase small subunit